MLDYIRQMVSYNQRWQPMGPMDNMNIELNQRVRLRKAHPCGGFEWRVVRLGADIGLECDTCGRRVLLTRRELAKRIHLVLDVGPTT